MSKFAAGVATGAVMLFIGLWLWLIHEIHSTNDIAESLDEEE